MRQIDSCRDVALLRLYRGMCSLKKEEGRRKKEEGSMFLGDSDPK
ncbi:MAG: hypothetical protein QNJ63_27485 [Calothrix sp. MO_192.B10]|nr:hypothetical protein [Calothrix sp. MO_192.B10]